MLEARCVLIGPGGLLTTRLRSMFERPVRVQEIIDEHCRGYPYELMNCRRRFREEHRQDYKSSVAHTQGHERYGIEFQTFYPHVVGRFTRTERPVVVEEEIGDD
jgi:hypothetical protein